MIHRKFIWRISAGLAALLSTISCGIQDNLELPATWCNETLSSNISYGEIRSLVDQEVVEITEDLTIEGYIISSDEAGNFFNTIHIQERFEEQALGFQLELELSDAHLFYPEGAHVFIRLQGLYIGKSAGIYKIGLAYKSFGRLNIGRIPTLLVDKHLLISCKKIEPLQPQKLRLDSLSDNYLSTYVELDQLEFNENDLGLSYANPMAETERILEDCDKNEIILLSSGYSDFHTEIIPEGNGSIRGVLLKDKNDFQIKVSRTSDIRFVDPRCDENRMPVTSDQVYISEIADPENENKARFVELYNNSEETISLDGWELRRYTNDQTEVSTRIDLSGHSIEAKGTLVISSDASTFVEIYGFASDLEGGSNSAADSNGDDNLELADPFGNVIDLFGIPGEDGSGTAHEFEDGGAFRKPEVMQGSSEFMPGQWIIYNDSGSAGTILQPLQAPEDFNPGIR